jgi:hypothetical protein
MISNQLMTTLSTTLNNTDVYIKLFNMVSLKFGERGGTTYNRSRLLMSYVW